MFKVSDGVSESAAASRMTIDVTAVNDPARGLPTISGTARVGQTLTADASGIADDADGLPAPSTFSYQWLRVDGGRDAEIQGGGVEDLPSGCGGCGREVQGDRELHGP